LGIFKIKYILPFSGWTHLQVAGAGVTVLRPHARRAGRLGVNYDYVISSIQEAIPQRRCAVRTDIVPEPFGFAQDKLREWDAIGAGWDVQAELWIGTRKLE
jgi:hypothetical protein